MLLVALCVFFFSSSNCKISLRTDDVWWGLLISVKYEDSISTDAFQFVRKLSRAVLTAGSDIGVLGECSNGEYVEGRFSSDRLGYRVVKKELREVSGLLKESGIRLP
jgi:hypothetical protein